MSESKQEQSKLPRRHFTPRRLVADAEAVSVVGGLFSGSAQMSFSRALKIGTPLVRELLFGLRKDYGLSRGQLASWIGVPQSTLKAWEMGKRSPSGAARKCIWLLDRVVRKNPLTDIMQLVLWDKVPLGRLPAGDLITPRKSATLP